MVQTQVVISGSQNFKFPDSPIESIVHMTTIFEHPYVQRMSQICSLYVFLLRIYKEIIGSGLIISCNTQY